MKRSRFTEAQIIGVVKQLEAGLKIGSFCRTHGISEQTAYRWKARLKRSVADWTLDGQALKEVVSRNW
jgi:putative transposase